ncbi:hypothetical protein [Micrococcus sp. TA1]|uniref:DUF7144 family membrane protein n=1 Tax=Micrococcus sp. TA1 TaxID=681627 RepID=UPI00161E4453|nr:hypothetical protein [Micrococcus sp. TA1]MBB5750342.1 hypothetical protein [Micrococcus sp. TA1]
MNTTTPTSDAAGTTLTRHPPESSGWVGWLVFAAVLMILLGAFHAIQGLIALFNSEYYLVGPQGLSIHLDYTTWGWVHLIAGTVVLVAGIGVLAGQFWARLVGILLAVVSALGSFAFIAAYPVWSCILIALDVLIIYALAVHGREIR